MYFLVLVVVGCQADFDVDNVQRRELVNVYGVERYIRVTTTNDDSYTALYPAKIYELAALYIINIKIRLTTKTVQVL